MACPHRFLSNHIINSLFPNWEFDYLFIGTFNPLWTFSRGQSAAYFYGRIVNNYYWDLIPEIWSNQKMRKSNSIAGEHFIQQNEIGITDLIKDITDANQNNVQHVTWLKDKADTGLVKFKNIDWNSPKIVNLTNCKSLLFSNAQFYKAHSIMNRTA